MSIHDKKILDLSLLVLLHYVLGGCIALSCCQTSWELLKVIPDIIAVIPPQALNVTFEASVKANEGNELTPTQVKNKPTVQWNADSESLYVLVMVDPDAPSKANPEFREWQHWLVGNIPGCDIEEGETLSEYIGAAPPNGAGLHRYVLLVYQQPKKLIFNEDRLTNTSANGRIKFCIRQFAEKYSLAEPIAGNFYQAQWDEYVPMVYKQLGAA